MRVVCPTMHAEHLHLDSGVGQRPVRPCRSRRCAGPSSSIRCWHESRESTSATSSRGSPIAVTRSRCTRIIIFSKAHPGHTTGFLMGQPLDEGDIHRCLSENYEYLGERGHTPRGFLSGNWLVLGATVEWLSATGLRVRLHAPHLFRRASQLDPRPERAACHRQSPRRPRRDPHDGVAQTAGAGRPHVPAASASTWRT